MRRNICGTDTGIKLKERTTRAAAPISAMDTGDGAAGSEELCDPDNDRPEAVLAGSQNHTYFMDPVHFDHLASVVGV